MSVVLAWPRCCTGSPMPPPRPASRSPDTLTARKVVLSALCNGPAPSRKVDSVLLLQPALSCYAFTADLDGKPGGYRPAFDRVRLPIITTYSGHDEPLTKVFHLAVRRQVRSRRSGDRRPAAVEVRGARWLRSPGCGR